MAGVVWLVLVVGMVGVVGVVGFFEVVWLVEMVCCGPAMIFLWICIDCNFFCGWAEGNLGCSPT